MSTYVLSRTRGLGPPTPLVHRKNRFGTNGQRVSRALLIATGIYVVVMVACWILLPLTQVEDVRVVEIPTEHIMVAEPPQVALSPPPALIPDVAPQVAVRQVADLPEGIVNEPKPLPLREREPRLDPDAGKEGRRRAEQATAQLASATKSLDAALGDLSSALRNSNDATSESSRRRRARALGGGRADGELAGIDAGTPQGGSADLAGSTVTGAIVAVGKLAPAPVEAGAGDDPAGRASAPGVNRTNASLLATIQRYAAGIQFCYESELAREPGLRGKIVVAITVSASGEVTEASVVQNTFGANRVASCALAQIRQWKFPPIASGATSFQTPFVFTPPN